MTTTTETKIACRWCEKGDEPKLLDNDGTLISINGEPGTLCHAHEEYWWPCLRYGVELHAQPTPAPQPALDAGEWRYRPTKVHDIFQVFTNTELLVATTYDEPTAAQIVSDHRSAAAVPKLAQALEALLPYLSTEAQMLDYASLNEGRASGFDVASMKVREALTTVQGKEQE